MSPTSITISSKSGTISVPAGTFSDVITLSFGQGCSDNGIKSAHFAKSVGFVKWEESDKKGILTTEMIKGKIGGKISP